MPGHGSKKQSQRTKGNLRPSSSSHAAELLQAAGTASTGFIGFGQKPMYVPASSTLDDVDSSLDSDIRMVLRKMSKRDTTTKIKGLQEFSEMCKEKSDECLKATLPFWPRTYKQIAMDVDHKVREAAQQAMSALVLRVKRNLAPYIKNLMGAWLLSQCDTYPTVASAAQLAFQNAFPPVKQTEALVFCKQSIMEFLTENLVTHTQQTLSDPKTTEPEDMENKYNRVLTSSLLAIRKLLTSIPANQTDSLNQQIASLLDNAKFWKHAKSKISMVRGALFSCLAGLCQSMSELSAQYVNKMAPLILHNLDEKDPAICTHLWEATLSLVNFSQDCWKHVNVQKGFWPKLKSVLETGCYGNAVVIGPSLLPLLSRIPADLFPDQSKFLNDFFESFRSGLSTPALQKSPSECGAAVKAYMECARYIIRQTEATPTPAHILIDQVLPIVEASLLENSSPFYQSPLYGMLGNILTGLELGENSAGKQTASQFWSQLKENVELNLSAEESSGGTPFEERLVYLVKYLFYPEAETFKPKTVRVKFKSIVDADAGDRVITEKTTKTMVQRAVIGNSAQAFVQDITLLTFELAHKHFSTTHLKVFSQLLELDSSEETISKVIECCHGEVATETTSHYFVFEICVPWLKTLQQRKDAKDTSEAFTHVVHIVCLFIPVLDKESVSALLEKLFEGCIDSEAEYILFEKLFSLSTVSQPVLDWLQGNRFTERLVSRIQAVSEATDMDKLTTDIDHSLSILTLVLNTKTDGEKLVVQQDSIEKLLKVLLQIVEGLSLSGTDSKTDSLASFVAKAACSFYNMYTVSFQMDAGNQLLLRLFQLSISNQYNVTADTLEEARQACTAGVREAVKLTGGLLYENGLLSKLSAIVQETLQAAVVFSLENVSVAMEAVKVILRAMLSSLPEGNGANPVYVSYCNQLMVPICGNVPHKIWSYLCVKGDYSSISASEDDGTFPVQTLFTSLYNCSLLSFVHTTAVSSIEELNDDQQMAVGKSELHWPSERLEKLVDCIQGSEIVQTFVQQNKMVLNFPLVLEASSKLSMHIKDLVRGLCQGDREALWKISFNRSGADQDYVLSQGGVLSLLSDLEAESLVLELAPILDRCSVLTEMSVTTLYNTVNYLSPNDQMTLTEIMVARILSLPEESVLNLDGGVGLLFSMVKLVGLVSQSHEQEAGELIPSALDQVMSWKEENSEILLYNSNVAESSDSSVLFNVVLARFLGASVQHLSHKLSQEQWDFIMCSLASWVQSIDESKADLVGCPLVQCFVASVCQLLVQIVICIKDKAVKSADIYPANLVTEWTEFFSESVFTVVLPLFLQIYKDLKDRSAAGTDALVLSAICESVSYTPEQHILEHKLPPLLVAGDLSPLPDNLQTLMNLFCPLLLANERAVQVSAFRILERVVGKLPEYDKDEKSFVAGATGGEEQEEETKRSPPSYLMSVLDQASLVLDELLCDVSVESCLPISALSKEYHYSVAYLLSWKLLLKFFGSAPSELRQEYAWYLRDRGFVERLMQHIFGLMPKNPGSMFQQEPAIAVRESGTSNEIQHLACSLYVQVLRTIPAMARNWWKEQDRKTAAYIDAFTTKYASQMLCSAEIHSIQTTENKLVDMTIKTRPATREVIATYSLEEVTIEMVISLPQNYPLGNISVTSEKRVGVSKPQWEKWLLQLNIFLQHQNGNILDGLKLWKNNIDKKFEGVEECMICFYVLHGTNFQLPKITCRTCKKKFHSACLFKWFKTSLNPTCPLCRNVF